MEIHGVWRSFFTYSTLISSSKLNKSLTFIRLFIIVWRNFNMSNLQRLGSFSNSPTTMFSLSIFWLKLVTRLSNALHVIVITLIKVVSSFFALFLRIVMNILFHLEWMQLYEYERHQLRLLSHQFQCHCLLHLDLTPPNISN